MTVLIIFFKTSSSDKVQTLDSPDKELPGHPYGRSVMVRMVSGPDGFSYPPEDRVKVIAFPKAHRQGQSII